MVPVTSRAPLVSFITPHGNRLEHLKQTIPHNLEVCKDLDCEFIVCHSGDQSDAAQWLAINYPQVNNYSIIGDRFHYARACNHAHRQARGIIQCTLDADQLLTKQYIKDLLEAFADGSDAIYHEHNAIANGPNDCAGRIGVLRATFGRIGGYEERFRAWGGVDTEFVNRCCDRVKLFNKRRMVVSDCIHHSDTIRQKSHHGCLEARRLFYKMEHSGITEANLGVPWGMSDDGCIPDHGSWGFNSGVLPIDGGYLVADRYLTTFNQWAMMLRRFDKQWYEIERICPEHWIGFEDMRLINTIDGILGYGTWATVKGQGHAWARHDVHMAMARIGVNGTLEACQPVHLTEDFPRQKMEKNWILFEHNGELLASYGLRPHMVLGVNKGTGLCSRKYISQTEDWKWPWGEPRGGSNWLSMGDHMLMCAHSMLDRIGMEGRNPVFASQNEKSKYYFAFFVMAERKPPFKIVAVGKDPLGIDHQIRIKPTIRDALVTFPMSLYRYGDDLCLAYGENDERTRVVKLAWEEVKATLVPVATSKAPYGEVRCA